MSTQIRYDRWGVGVRDDTITVQAHLAADPITQRAQDSMTQLVRQGQDASLRSLQVWADLARKLDPSALSPSVGAMLSLAYGPFEKLLVAQRQIVDDLVATQRELARQLVETTAGCGDASVRR